MAYSKGFKISKNTKYYATSKGPAISYGKGPVKFSTGQRYNQISVGPKCGPRYKYRFK